MPRLLIDTVMGVLKERVPFIRVFRIGYYCRSERVAESSEAPEERKGSTP